MTSNAAYDTYIELITPENIAFQHRVAGPFRRVIAYGIDLTLRGIVLLGVGIVLTISSIAIGNLSLGIMLLLVFFMDWIYGASFEALFNGQTPGKWMLRLRVVTVEGQPIAVWQAILRNLLRLVDLMPGYLGYNLPLYFGLFGLVAATSNRRFQRLGDMFAGTMVVVEESQRLFGVVRIEEPGALEIARQLPPSFRPSRALSRALSDYVLRRRSFSPARRAELAQLIGVPLCETLDLPPQTNHDLLLCALYHQTFLSDRNQDADERPLRKAAAAAAWPAQRVP